MEIGPRKRYLTSIDALIVRIKKKTHLRQEFEEEVKENNNHKFCEDNDNRKQNKFVNSSVMTNLFLVFFLPTDRRCLKAFTASYMTMRSS